jgi:prepilin-type N-terminal cleavage/methylation domain-containing protein
MLRKMLAKRQSENGFTLIELLVVILIIGILATIAVPVFLNQRKVAQEGALKSDLKNAGLAFEQYLVSNKSYPSKTEDVPVQTSTGTHIEIPTVDYVTISMQEMGKPEAVDVKWKMTSDGTTQNAVLYRSGYSVNSYLINALVRTNCSDGTKPDNSVNFWLNSSSSDKVDQYVGGVPACASPAKAESVTIASMYNSIIPTTTITPAQKASAASNAKDFCIQGYHDSNPANFWKYASSQGGLVQGKC